MARWRRTPRICRWAKGTIAKFLLDFGIAVDKAKEARENLSRSTLPSGRIKG
jgi:hypothetical protein